MLATAAWERRARRAQALHRAARRTERARRELVRSLEEALRLHGELPAERGGLTVLGGQPAAEQTR